MEAEGPKSSPRAKDWCWLQRQGRRWHIALARKAGYMLETHRENGKASSRGSLPRKPYPPGSPACLPKSLFLGKFASFICPLQREEKPQDMGDLWDSFFKDEFLCLQWETHMPLRFTKDGDSGKQMCPVVGIISPGCGSGQVVWVMGELPVCFPSFRFTSTIAVSQKRKFPTSTVLERNFESSSYYTSCRHMTMR